MGPWRGRKGNYICISSHLSLRREKNIDVGGGESSVITSVDTHHPGLLPGLQLQLAKLEITFISRCLTVAPYFGVWEVRSLCPSVGSPPATGVMNHVGQPYVMRQPIARTPCHPRYAIASTVSNFVTDVEQSKNTI